MRSHPLTHLLLPWLALAVVGTGISCGDPGDRGRGAAPASNSDEVADAEPDLDDLLALPYAGYVEEEEEGKQRSGVVLFDEERSQPGYNLYSAFRLASAHLVDARGELIRSWSDPEGYHWARCRLLPDGDLLVVGSSRVDADQEVILDEGRYVAQYSWDGELRWKRELPAHHDIEVTPEGRLAVLGFHYTRNPAVHAKAQLRDDDLLILSAEGELLERYSLFELMGDAPDVFELKKVPARDRKRAFEVEPFHSNSVEHMRHPHLEARDPIYAAGNVLISMRHQDAVAIVDPDAGRVVWSWGRGKLLGPHSATLLESGNILIFDNGLGRGWSRSIEIDPLRREVVWKYLAPRKKDFYSASRGSNQRLANGNTLITNSDNGYAFEVTPDGDRVWEFWAPHFDDRGRRATLVQTERYEVGYVENILEQTADGD